MVALVALHHECVGNKISVKRDGGGRTDGTDEGILEQTYLILVEVHIREAVGQHTREDVARIDELTDTITALSLHDGLLLKRVLAIDDLAHLLVHGQGQDKLARLGTGVHMVLQIGHAAEMLILQYLVGHLVQRERHLLILMITEKVSLADIGLLLGLYHSPHHLHRRIVLTTVTLTLGLHLHFPQRRMLLAQTHIQPLHFPDLHSP